MAEMLVVERGEVVIVVAREGQAMPSDETLRELYGISPDDVIPLSQSKARPATDADKIAAHVDDQQARADTGDAGELAALKARVAELEAQAPPVPPVPPVPPGPGADAGGIPAVAGAGTDTAKTADKAPDTAKK